MAVSFFLSSFRPFQEVLSHKLSCFLIVPSSQVLLELLDRTLRHLNWLDSAIVTLLLIHLGWLHWFVRRVFHQVVKHHDLLASSVQAWLLRVRIIFNLLHWLITIPLLTLWIPSYLVVPLLLPPLSKHLSCHKCLTELSLSAPLALSVESMVFDLQLHHFVLLVHTFNLAFQFTLSKHVQNLSYYPYLLSSRYVNLIQVLGDSLKVEFDLWNGSPDLEVSSL